MDLDGVEVSPRCADCGFAFRNHDGIWRALAPGRETEFDQFIREYETVREHEGRGSESAEYYLALPYHDMTGRNDWQWRIRQRSFSHLKQNALARLKARHPQGLDILDLGAGNGWMSYRLALEGHRPVAVDLRTGDRDGLGAARHYVDALPKPFLRFQAEMDRLPFGPRQFDVAIFNASFHYSTDYSRTLAEALRCLRPRGHVAIVDSPLYHREESGHQMVAERRASFEKVYGFRSDSIPSREYLTPAILGSLSRECGVSWKVLKPWYGIEWALRPLRARLQGQREPSKFYILWGERRSQ